MPRTALHYLPYIDVFHLDCLGLGLFELTVRVDEGKKSILHITVILYHFSVLPFDAIIDLCTGQIAFNVTLQGIDAVFFIERFSS